MPLDYHIASFVGLYVALVAREVRIYSLERYRGGEGKNYRSTSQTWTSGEQFCPVG